MILGLGDPELATDITGEQESPRANDRVEAAERIRVMAMDVVGNALGRTSMYAVRFASALPQA